MYNVVFISAVEQSDSFVHVHLSIPFFCIIISHLIKKSTYGYINLLDQTGETDSNRTEAML